MKHLQLVVALLVVSGLAAHPRDAAAAQEAANTGQPASFEFNIEAQSLGDALKRFSATTGIQHFFAEKSIAALPAPAVRGKLTAREALDKLINGKSLQLRFSDERTVILKTATITVSQAGTGTSAQLTPVVASDAVLMGQVTDGPTGRRLAGALVRLVETGQTTHTDDAGNFRFHGLAPGQYTVSITYLGYPDKLSTASAAPDGEVQAFVLGVNESEEAEMTVFGTRSARAIALNQQRTADNNQDVISADMLGNFSGTTISEALRRVSGVTFRRNEDTGAGSNIMIRGLQPEMNHVKLNGVTLPGTGPRNRTPELDNLLADSVSKITIHKTLLASQDSSGTGGLVEIETKSPLERPARYANLAVEGGQRGGDFGDDFLVSGTVSHIFGEAGNLGFSASAQYTEAMHHNTSFSRDLRFGEYLPLSPMGTATFGISDFDPRLDFPYAPGDDQVFMTGTNLNSSNNKSAVLNVTLSGEWQPTSGSSLKLDVTRSKSNSDNFAAYGSIALPSDYVLRPVTALGGEQRLALTYFYTANLSQSYSLNGGDIVTDTYSLRGSANPGRWRLGYTLGTARTSTAYSSRSLSLGYQSKPAAIFGEDLHDEDFLPAAYDPGAPSGQRVLAPPFPHVSGKKLLLPLFTPQTWAFFNDANHYDFRGANQDGTVPSSNSQRTADLSAHYETGRHWLPYFETGAHVASGGFKARESTFTHASPLTTSVDVPGLPFPATIYPSLAPLGVHFKETDLSRVGNPGQGLHYLDEGGVRDFLSHLNDFAAQHPEVISDISTSELDPLRQQLSADERSFDAYLQGKLVFGKFEAIPGLRLDGERIHARTIKSTVVVAHFYDPLPVFDERKLVDLSVTRYDLLPRVDFNYRQTDKLIFRGGYFLTTARPSVTDLSGASAIALYQDGGFYSPDGRPALVINQGNPELKPAITHNFDLDVEWYDGNVGLIRLGGFYKRIQNALQANEIKNLQSLDGIDLPDNQYFNGITPQNTFLFVSTPKNSDDPAMLWGVEGHVERQFTFLPGVWSGLGVYANYTYTDSDALQSVIWQAPSVIDADGNVLERQPQVINLPHERFDFQAANSGTVGLTYNKSGIDATLSYAFQDRYQSGFSPNNLGQFVEGVGTLDLHVAYFFERGGVKWRTFLEGTDLLKGTKDTDLLNSWGGVEGIAKYYTSGAYLGGRELRLGVNATF